MFSHPFYLSLSLLLSFLLLFFPQRSGKENKPPHSDHKKQDIPPDHWKDRMADVTSGDPRMNARGHRGSPPNPGSPILTAEPQIYQQGLPHYPLHHDPYHPHPQQPYVHGSVYTPYPPSHPPRGSTFGPSPSKLRRVGGEQEGGHEGHHDFHPHWEQESDHRHKRRLGSTQDERTKENHPRIMKHSREDRMQPCGRFDQQGPGQSVASTEERSQPSPSDQHLAVTGERNQPSPGDQHQAVPQPRSQPRKIMIRNLSDQVSSGDQSQMRTHSNLQAVDSRPGSQRDRGGGGLIGKGVNQVLPPKPKMAWGATNEPSRVPTPPPQTLTPTDEQSQQQKVMWNIEERGPISTPKMLYEPEGRTSEEKFKKYHRSVSSGETTNATGASTRGRISSTGSDKGSKGECSEDGPSFRSDGEQQRAPLRGERRDENADREQPVERARPHTHLERLQQREVGKRRSDHSPPLPTYKQPQQQEEEPFVDDQRTSGRRDGRRPRSRGQEERREKEDASKLERKGRNDQRRDDPRKDETRRNIRDRRRGSRDDPVETRRGAPLRSRGEHDAPSGGEHNVSSRGRGGDQHAPPKGKGRENDVPLRAMGERDAPPRVRGEHYTPSRGKEHSAPPRQRGEHDAPSRSKGEHGTSSRGKEHDAHLRGRGEHSVPSRGWGDHDRVPKGRGRHEVALREMEELDKCAQPNPNQRDQTGKSSFTGRARDETPTQEPLRAEKGEKRSNQHHSKPVDNRIENQQRSTQEQGPVDYGEGRKMVDRREMVEPRRGRKSRGGPRNRPDTQSTVPGWRPSQNQSEAPPHSSQSVDFERREIDERRTRKGAVGPAIDNRGKRKPRGEESKQSRRGEQDNWIEPDRPEPVSVGMEPNLPEQTKRKDVNSSSLDMQTRPKVAMQNEPEMQEFDSWDRPLPRGGGHRGASRGRSRSGRREQDRGGGKEVNQPKRKEDREPPPTPRGRGERGGSSRGQRPGGRQRTKADQPSHWREEDISRPPMPSGRESGCHSAELTPGKIPAGRRQKGGNVVSRERVEPTRPPASQVVYDNLENVSSASDWEDEVELPYNQPQHRHHSGVTEGKSIEDHTGPPPPLISLPPPRDDRPPRRGGRLGSRGFGGGRGRVQGDRRSGPSSSNRPGPQGRGESGATRGETSIGRGGRRREQSVTDPGKPGSGGTSDGRQIHPISTTQDPKRHQDMAASAAASRKGQDIANYDLNSHNVHVVDRQGESRRESQAILSPTVGDSDGFTVVISKKERKENNREEKRKHEVEKRRHEDDHQHSHRQRSSQSARFLVEQGEAGGTSKTSQPSQSDWGGAGEFAAPKSVDIIWSQTEKGTTVWSPAQSESLSLASFGAVGDKPTKEQPLSSGIHPFSSSLLHSGSYNMWSTDSDFFSSPPQGVAARKGGMLQAAIDSSMIAATAPLPPTNQPNPAPLTQILIEQEVLVKPGQIESGKTSGGHRELPPQLQQQRDARAAVPVGPPKHSRIEPEEKGQGRGGGVAKVCLGGPLFSITSNFSVRGCIHIHIYTYVRTYIHIHTRTYVRVYVRTYIHTYRKSLKCEGVKHSEK